MRDSEKDTGFPSPRLRESCRLIARLVSLSLWRIEFHETENIPPADSGGFVIAANHQTYFDPVWISIPIKQDIRYLAWDRAFDWPIIGSLISRLGAMPVSLERGSAPATLKKAISLVERGSALMIFPEGEREFRDGNLLKFRTGAAHIAIKTGVPILPVTISGGNRVWPRDFRLPRTGKVLIHYHPLIESTDSAGATYSAGELTELLAQKIKNRPRPVIEEAEEEEG